MDRLCVYCGSHLGTDPRYRAAAVAFGQAMAARDIDLVYGGGGVGLMGVLATTVLDGGSAAIGVIPAAIRDREQPPDALTDLHVVDTMHERKQTMFDLADGFVALPGGLGTLDELFEMLTWAQIGMHDKPCGLLNVDGYFDDLIAFIETAVAEGFVRQEHRALLTVRDDREALLDALEPATGPDGDRSLDSRDT